MKSKHNSVYMDGRFKHKKMQDSVICMKLANGQQMETGISMTGQTDS